MATQRNSITVENIDISEVADPDSYIAAVACLYGDIYAAIEWLAKNVENAKVFYCAGAVGGVFEAYKVGVDRLWKIIKTPLKWSACPMATGIQKTA